MGKKLQRFVSQEKEIFMHVGDGVFLGIMFLRRKRRC